jgi:hypothetical protein
VQLARYKPTAQVAMRESTAQDEFYQTPFWETVNEAVMWGKLRPAWPFTLSCRSDPERSFSIPGGRRLRRGRRDRGW